jgi:hypothetical protein
MSEASEVFAIDQVKGIGWVKAFAVGVLSAILMFFIPYLVRKIDGGIAPLVIFPLVALVVGYGAVRFGRLPIRWVLGVGVVNSFIMALGFAFIETFKPTPFHPFAAVRIMIQVLQYFVFQGLPYAIGSLIGRAVLHGQLAKRVNVTN